MELHRAKPPALTTLQRRLIGFTTLVVAMTRIWARSQTLWDWDETLFSLSLHDFDVVKHHPHPPGFPLYVAMGKVLRLLIHSDFHALQAITTTAAIALFPLLFWLAWELRFPFRVGFLGSLLFIFLPNVWFYGGTAFSDIPGLALVIAACATLLRGCSDRRAYFAGALLLGLAAAIRPQALAIGCAPALVASWYRIREKRWVDVVKALAIGIAVLAVSYGGAALASESVARYIAMNGVLREYVRKVDSYLNPGRATVISLFGDFFIHAIPGGRITEVIAAFSLFSVLVSIARRKPGVWLLVAMFLPFNTIGWFMLDTNSISRYAVGFAAMYALLAVDGIDSLLTMVWRRSPSLAVPVIEAVVVMAIIARFVWWTLPALRDVRSTPSPPVAAMQWIRDNVPRSGRLYVQFASLKPYSELLLDGYQFTLIDDPSELAVRPIGRDEWYVTEGATAVLGGHNFVRARGTLFNIARQRYFEVSVAPMDGVFRFGRGWYGEESVGDSAWRWMSGQSETLLPPIAGKGRLTLAFELPSELVPRHPRVDIRLNGQLVDQISGTTPTVTKSWIVPARGDAWNKLEISMDKVLNPAKEGITPDPRDLGLRLTAYAWEPAGAP